MPVAAAIVCFSAAVCSPESVIVIDGDTIVVQGEHIRILGINAPELSKAKCRDETVRGLRARSRLMDLMQAGNVVVERGEGTERFDRYRRTLAHVSVDGVDVGETLMREGLARRWVQKYVKMEEPWCQSNVDAALKAWN
jgi:endonuclease YncB( thermonuclease family)